MNSKSPAALAGANGAGKKINKRKSYRPKGDSYSSQAETRFAALPKRALFDARLNRTHLRVLGIIALYDGRGDGCWQSQRCMALELRVDLGDFSRALKELSLWGYVRREQKPRDKRMQLYRVSYSAEEIIGSVPNNLVGSGTNDLEQMVGSGPNKSLGQSEKIGSQNNGLSPLLEPTRSLLAQNQAGSALPSPLESEASASPENKNGLQRTSGTEASKRSNVISFHEGPMSKEEGRAKFEALTAKLRRLSGGGGAA